MTRRTLLKLSRGSSDGGGGSATTAAYHDGADFRFVPIDPVQLRPKNSWKWTVSWKLPRKWARPARMVE